MTSTTPWSTAVRFNLIFPDHQVVRNITKAHVLSRIAHRLRIGRITPDDVWYTILVQGLDQYGRFVPNHPIRIANCPLFVPDLQTAPWFQQHWKIYQPVGNPPPPPEPRFFVRGHPDMTIRELVGEMVRCPEQKLFVRQESEEEWREALTIPDIVNQLNHQKDLSTDK